MRSQFGLAVRASPCSVSRLMLMEISRSVGSVMPEMTAVRPRVAREDKRRTWRRGCIVEISMGDVVFGSERC